MRKLVDFLFLCLMAVVPIACGDDGDDSTGGNGNNSEKPDQPSGNQQPVAMNIYTLVGADNADHPVPRLIAEWGESMVAQVTDPNHPGMMMFQYVNSHAEYDAAVLVTEHNVIFFHYNPMTDKEFPKDAVVMSAYDNFSSVSSCTIDWAKNDIKVKTTVALDKKKARRHAATATRSDDDALKKPFFDMLDDIGSGIGTIKDVVSKFGPAGKSAAILCDAWTTVLIPIMKYQLYDNGEIGQRQFVEDMFTSQVMSVVEEATNKQVDKLKDQSVSYLCKVTRVDKEDVNMALWAYDLTERVVDLTGMERNFDLDEYVDKGLKALTDYGKNVDEAEDVLSDTFDPDDNDEPDDTGTSWEDTRWQFSGTMTIVDSDEGYEEGLLEFGVDLTSVAGWSVTGLDGLDMDNGTKTYRISDNGDLVLFVTGSDNYTNGSYQEKGSWTHTLTLHRSSASTAILWWDGQDSGSWSDPVLKESGSYNSVFKGTFNGKLIK